MQPIVCEDMRINLTLSEEYEDDICHLARVKRTAHWGVLLGNKARASSGRGPP